MKKLLLLLLLLPSLVFSQCDDQYTPTIVQLTSIDFEDVTFQLCYEDSTDILIVTQVYNKQDLDKPKIIRSVEEGKYLLKNNRAVIFYSDNSKFQFKLIKEQRLFIIDMHDEVAVYSYYEVNRSKLKLLMMGNIEVIDIVKNDEIQTFDVPYTQSMEFYQMAFRYFKFKKWR